MEHFIRIAFWIVALSTCLQGNPVPFIYIKDWNVELLETVNCSDSTMYSPTDVTNKCFVTALKCIKDELIGRAKVECEDPENHISQGISTVAHVISEMKKRSNQMVNNSSECDCHNWPERPFEKFVNDVKSLLQNINANF